MSWIEITLLIVSGVFVGFINTLAGGGSIISLSLLMFFGLPANIANGTNRIGILMQTLTSVGSFRKQEMLDLRKGLWLAIPALIGSIIGAWIAVDIDKKIIEKAIAFVMILMLFFLLYKPQRWLKGDASLMAKPTGVWQILIFFLIGIYGGFIQLGVGYFLLAGLVFSTGYDLVKANALKNLIVLMYAPFTLVVFIINDQVEWLYGLLIAAGSVIGAYIASRMAVKKGANFVRWIVIIVIIITALQLFGLYDFHSLFRAVLS